MPAIVDDEPHGGGAPLALFESGAILEYLADKTGRVLPRAGAGRYAVLQWVYWQMANLGPMMGNANHFRNYAKRLTGDPKQLEYATKRFVGEVERLCGVMDAQLAVHPFLAGADYSIADIITWPWAMLLGRLIDEALWETFPNVKRWVEELRSRPAVQRGFDVGKEWRDRQRTPEEEKRASAILEYLADKTGKFLPRSGHARYTVLQWVHWQMANLGPMMGNANHFKNYAKQLVDDADQLAYGTRRFVGEVDRLCGVMDAQLSANRHLAGPDYTIADIVTWPWASLVGRLIDENVWTQVPNLKRWADEVGARPAVERGRHLHKELGERQLTDEEQRRRKELLFNQTNEKVRAAREAAAKAAP